MILKKINDADGLKEQLEIKNNFKYSKSIEKILIDTRHKIDILYDYRIKHKLPYNELSFLKVTANCVIDQAIKKRFKFKRINKASFF